MACVKPEIPKQPLTDQELAEVSSTLGTIIKLYKRSEDTRRCLLCHHSGDGKINGAARLLNMDGDKYVHLNCALWSYEVYETLNGALMNVDAACKHALTVECVGCKKKGATVGCFKSKCTNLYHISCAQKAGVVFYQNKTVLCPGHQPKLGLGTEDVLSSLLVRRRVFVNRDDNRQIAR